MKIGDKVVRLPQTKEHNLLWQKFFIENGFPCDELFLKSFQISEIYLTTIGFAEGPTLWLKKYFKVIEQGTQSIDYEAY